MQDQERGTPPQIFDGISDDRVVEINKNEVSKATESQKTSITPVIPTENLELVNNIKTAEKTRILDTIKLYETITQEDLDDLKEKNLDKKIIKDSISEYDIPYIVDKIRIRGMFDLSESTIIIIFSKGLDKIIEKNRTNLVVAQYKDDYNRIKYYYGPGEILRGRFKDFENNILQDKNTYITEYYKQYNNERLKDIFDVNLVDSPAKIQDELSSNAVIETKDIKNEIKNPNNENYPESEYEDLTPEQAKEIINLYENVKDNLLELIKSENDMNYIKLYNDLFTQLNNFNRKASNQKYPKLVRINKY